MRTTPRLIMLAAMCLAPLPACALDGSVVFVTKEGGVVLYNMASGAKTVLCTVGAQPRTCFSPDGREVAARMGDGRIRLFTVDGSGYRDILMTAGGVRCPANPWIQWVSSGDIYWGGGEGATWNAWTGPHNNVYRVDPLSDRAELVFADTTGMYSTLSFSDDGSIAYKHRRWDLSGVLPTVHYMGDCGAAMSRSGRIIAKTIPYHRSVQFFWRDSLERCCTANPYERCWGGGCYDTMGCAWKCPGKAWVDSIGLPPEVWEPRFATPPQAGDEWLTAYKGFGGPEGAYLFNRVTKAYWHFVPDSFGSTIITPGDFWPGALPPPAATPVLRLERPAVVLQGAAADTLRVTNGGSGTLRRVTVVRSATWLTVTVLDSGNIQRIRSTGNSTGLATGVYSDTVRVSGGGAPNTVSYVVQFSVGGALVAPSELAGRVDGPGGAVVLTWVDNSGNEDGFRVERRTGAGAWAEVGAAAPNAVTFRDSSVSASGTYSYRVRASRGAEFSGYSSVVDVLYVSGSAIVITAPQASDTWVVGTTAHVRWSAGAEVGSAGIEISFSAGDRWQSIVGTGSIAPSSLQWGDFTYVVPDSVGDQVYVKVYDYSNSGGAQATAGPVSIARPSSAAVPRIGRLTPWCRRAVNGSLVVGLATPGAYRIAIHDLAGRQVQVVQGVAAAGSQEVAIALTPTKGSGSVLLVRVTTPSGEIGFRTLAW
jgi:hypothetical protein